MTAPEPLFSGAFGISISGGFLYGANTQLTAFAVLELAAKMRQTSDRIIASKSKLLFGSRSWRAVERLPSAELNRSRSEAAGTRRYIAQQIDHYLSHGSRVGNLAVN
jgi:hypothetical protein